MKRLPFLLVLVIILILLISACLETKSPTPLAKLQTSINTEPDTGLVTAPILPSPTSIPTEAPAVTPTEEIQPTPTILRAAQLLPPFSVASSAVLTCENRAELIHQLQSNPQKGVLPGTPVIITFRFQNTGTCPWTTDYSLILNSGDSLGDTASFPLPESVATGGTVDLQLFLKAPTSPGEYMTTYLLQDATGISFGFGEKATKKIVFNLKVNSTTSKNSQDKFWKNDCL